MQKFIYRLFVEPKIYIAEKIIFIDLVQLMGACEALDHKIDPLYDLIMNPDLAKNEWPSVLDDIKKSEGHQSLMAKAMTK